MSTFHVEVNDPAYPEGTELSVTGFNILFVNGQSYDISEDDTNPNFEGDLETTLHAVAGFTVSQTGDTVDNSASPPVGVASAEGAANVTINEVPVEVTQSGGEH